MLIGKCGLLRGGLQSDPDNNKGVTASETSLRAMELQWSSYVDNLKAAGSLTNALAICDVSGSMSGLPMEVMCPSYIPLTPNKLVWVQTICAQCLVQNRDICLHWSDVCEHVLYACRLARF